MEKIHKAQVAKALVVFIFLLIVPFVSASMRLSYLYFLLNLLIIVLAIESGLLGAFLAPPEEKRAIVFASRPITPLPDDSSHNVSSCAPNEQPTKVVAEEKKPTMVVSAEKKAIVTVDMERKLKRCPTRPSLFFIGSYDEPDVTDDEEEERVVAEEGMEDVFTSRELSKQELFARAEMFIGNFYKQLKIQREESWKKIHMAFT